MSVRNKLLDEINRKAQKIRDKREEAANNKHLEAYVYDYFRQVDEVRQMPIDDFTKQWMFEEARIALATKVKTIDHNQPQVIPVITDDGTIQGVRIVWSKIYIALNKCEPEHYIDVSQMLLSL